VTLRGLTNVDALFVFASAAFNIRRIVTLRATTAWEGDAGTVDAVRPVQRGGGPPTAPRHHASPAAARRQTA